MEKVISRTVTRMVNEYEYYCDDCNKFLGRTVDNPDGWHPRFGERELSFNLGKGYGWFTSTKTLCDDCYNEYREEVKNALEALGFRSGL